MPEGTRPRALSGVAWTVSLRSASHHHIAASWARWRGLAVQDRLNDRRHQMAPPSAVLRYAVRGITTVCLQRPDALGRPPKPARPWRTPSTTSRRRIDRPLQSHGTRPTKVSPMTEAMGRSLPFGTVDPQNAARWCLMVGSRPPLPGSTTTRSNRTGSRGRGVPSGRTPRSRSPYAAILRWVRFRWSTVSSGRPNPRDARQRTSTITSWAGGPGSTATRSSS